MKLNIVRHVYKVILYLKKLKLMQIIFKMDTIFLIVTKCESKNYLYIYYIKLIKENNQFKKNYF